MNQQRDQRTLHHPCSALCRKTVALIINAVMGKLKKIGFPTFSNKAVGAIIREVNGMKKVFVGTEISPQ